MDVENRLDEEELKRRRRQRGGKEQGRWGAKRLIGRHESHVMVESLTGE